MEALERRVAALERRQGRLAIGCATLAVALAASVLRPLLWLPREVSARRFVVKDADGGTRGRWGPRDATAGEIDGVAQYASATCLEINAARKTNGVMRVCVPWDGEGGPHLTMVEKTGASLDIGVAPYTVSVLGRTSRARADRGALVLGVWQETASIQVSDRDGRRTQVRSDGLRSYEVEGTVTEPSRSPPSEPEGRTGPRPLPTPR